MADNQPKQEMGNLGEIGGIIKATLDPINKFWEGIAQILMEIVKDRKLYELIVLLATGAIIGRAFLTKLEELVKEDAAERVQARLMVRNYYLELLQAYGNKLLKASQEQIEHIKAKFKEWDQKDRQRGAELCEQARQDLRRTKHFKWLAELVPVVPVEGGER